jgi:2'-5' RNA ligase
VTVAKLRYATPDSVARILGRIGAFRSEPFLVGRFAMFSAKPNTGGGPYVVETTFPLRGGEFANYQDLEGSW